jgi:SAM-dependent methyltransferase
MIGDNAALKAQVRDSYATSASLEIYRKRVDNGLRMWEATLIRQYFPAGGRVLTVGCGAGRETFALEQLGYDVVGVDISLPLLRIARELRIQRQHRSSFYLIDGETLPFANEVFEVVTLWAQMLDNVPLGSERLALMREVRRVLRIGGIATYSAHDDERTRPAVDPQTVLSADFPQRGDFIIHERREGAARYSHLFTYGELTQLSHDAGFVESSIYHTSDLGEAWDNVFVGLCRK